MLSRKDLKKIESAIARHKAHTIALQVPEGLKTQLRAISQDIEKLEVDVLIFADPCFGACDIPDLTMKRYGCDLIVHIGHSMMIKRLALPVVYIEYFENKDIAAILEKEIGKLDAYKNIGLATTIQHILEIEKVTDMLKRHKKKVYTGKPTIAKYPGQVLGCDPSAATKLEGKVDCIIYFGTGKFHPLGIAKKTGLPVFLLSLEDHRLHDLKKEQLLFQKKNIILKHKFKESKTVCIIASTKPGQMEKNIIPLKKSIETMGKSAFIVVMDHIRPESILGMEYDIIVNSACPRIEEDRIFNKPIINAADIF